MATSQNGWPVLSGYGDKKLVKIPYITGKVLGGDVAWVLQDFVSWFHVNIEPLDKGVDDDWGFAPRPIAGTSVISNHASGTAIDLNAVRHPMFRDTMNDATENKIRLRLKRYKGAIRWGGDYRTGRIDQMHFEVNVTQAKLKRIVDELKTGKVPPTITPTAPKPTVPRKGWPYEQMKIKTSHTAESDKAWRKVHASVGYRDESVTTNMQRWLRDRKDKNGNRYYSGIIEADHGKTPVFGPMLVKALQLFLKERKFYDGLIDGKRQSMTVQGEFKYLNFQAQYND